MNNSISPVNFRSNYIIKGHPRDLEKIYDIIDSELYDNGIPAKLKNADFYNFNYEELIKNYSPKQTYTEYLYATNEDAELVLYK